MKKRTPKQLRIGAFIIFLLMILIATCYSQQSNPSLPLGRGKYSVPIWSPDGRRAIASLRRNITLELWLFTESQEWHSVILDPTEAPYLMGTWRDNNTYLFSSRERKESVIGGQRRLLEYTVSGDILEVLRNLEYTLSGTINPLDTDTMLFVREREDVDDPIIAMDLNDLTVSEYEVQPHISAHDVLWSPDGTKLAYKYAGNGIPRYVGRGIGIWEDGDVQEFQLPLRIGENVYTWSPDSSAILFVGHYEPNGLYLLNLEEPDSPPTLIKEGRFAEVSWSPDGSTIAYTTLTFTTENELYLVPSEELSLEHYKPEVGDSSNQ